MLARNFIVFTVFLSLTFFGDRLFSQRKSIRTIKKLFKLTIRTSPAGAEIFIDGKLKGKSPKTIVVKKGKVKIEIKKRGYKTYKRVIAVTKSTELKVKLIKISNPKAVKGMGGKVKHPVKKGTPRKASHKSGKFKKYPTKKGHAIVRKKGSRKNKKHKGVKKGSVASYGVLVVQTAPSGAKIFINNKFSGVSNKKFRLKPGKYFVVVKLRGLKEAKKMVVISPGKVFHVKFNMKKGAVRITKKRIVKKKVVKHKGKTKSVLVKEEEESGGYAYGGEDYDEEDYGGSGGGGYSGGPSISTLGWLLFGVGAVVTGGAVYTNMLANEKYDKINNAATDSSGLIVSISQRQAYKYKDDGDTYKKVSQILYVVGIVSMGVSVFMIGSGNSHRGYGKSKSHIKPVIGFTPDLNGGGYVTLVGSF